MFKFHNLNLRFLGEEDENGGSGQSGNEGNPAWDNIKSLVDEDTFSRLEPEFKKWDSGVQNRFQTLSDKYKPFDSIIENRQPEWLEQAVNIAEIIDKNPQQIYEKLGQYLNQNNSDDSDNSNNESDENSEEETSGIFDPRIQRLEQQQAQFQQMIEQQQQRDAQTRAEQQLEAEITALRKAHTELDDDDVHEIIQRAALEAQRSQGKSGAKIPTLEDAYTGYMDFQNRILSKERPGNTAPDLVPPGGGSSSGNDNNKSWGKLNKNEMVDAVAALIKSSKG